jgi:DNA helicase II / ATP-dependent DNA helicase PcrA
MPMDLNPAQQQAVNSLSGPLLVLAGAGSGKTRVITFRTANLIRHKVAPNRILAVTFTNKAAQEMQERISHQLGGGRKSRFSDENKPVIGTFHANCVQILRRHANVLGYPAKFAIYDRGEQESVARGVLRDLRIHNEVLKPSDFLGIVGRWKNAGISQESAAQAAKTDKEHLAASGYRRYQRAIKLAGAMDFDDLLLNTEELLTQHEEVRQAEAGRFDYIMVDEYQDTNGSQYRIIKCLAQGHRNLCVVGDDDQSIYGWRGAEVQHILGFRRDWPEAVVVRLEENYRSSGAIVEMANTLIRFNKHRHDKVLRPCRGQGPAPRILQFESETEEAEGVAQEIARRLANENQLRPADFAILFRTNEQPRVFEIELRKAKVPYILKGSQSFFDRKEVRDVLAYLRIIDSPIDEVSLLRIINTPARGLGDKSVETLMNAAVSQGKPMWEVLSQPETIANLPPAAKRGVADLQFLVTDMQSKVGQVGLDEIVRNVLAHTRYLADISRQYPDPEEIETRTNSVEEVINAIADYQLQKKEPTLNGFLTEVALAGKEFESPKEKQMQQNAVSLMTLHSAKGLEFPIVYMVGMEEGILPHQRSVMGDGNEVDEERRLCYVGITRAQDELTLSLPLSRMKWGKPRPTFVSRFLYEATNQADNPNCMKAIQASISQTRKPARPNSKSNTKTKAKTKSKKS